MKNIHVFTADVDRTLRGKNNPGPLTLSAFEKLHEKGMADRNRIRTSFMAGNGRTLQTMGTLFPV